MSNVHVVSPEQSYRAATIHAFLAVAQQFDVDVSLVADPDMGTLKVLTAVMQRVREIEDRLTALEAGARP